jgi:hypothetical protein
MASKIVELQNISKRFNNPKLKKIINTYHLSFKNSNTPGFGDYLRGCFCLYQVAKILDLEFDMDMKNHPMSKFLFDYTENTTTTTSVNYNEVCRFNNDNYVGIDLKHYKNKSPEFLNELINHLNSINEEDYYLFSNAFPIFSRFRNEARQFIKSKIVPNEMMQQNIRLRMKNLGLKRKRYSVIHLRVGDGYLLSNDTINQNNLLFFEQISQFLTNNMNADSKYLLLADNNYIKKLMKDRFPSIVVQNRPITHLGEQSELSDVEVMNTLLDFYTMANSNKIFSFSKFNWGSGFSEWCGVVYNIPYVKVIV